MTYKRLAIFCLLPITIGFFLVWPGIFAAGYLFDGAETILLGVCGMFFIAYSVLGIVTLVWAWMTDGTKPAKLMMPFSISYVAAYAVMMIDINDFSTVKIILRLMGILFIAALVWVHWYMVSKISSWKQNA